MIDLPNFNNNSVRDIFKSLRPDITIMNPAGQLSVWELTICHESNLVNSKAYKQAKYKNLARDLTTQYASYKVEVETIEISSLGIVSDERSFKNKLLNQEISIPVLNDIMKAAISSSYDIYKWRNIVN